MTFSRAFKTAGGLAIGSLLISLSACIPENQDETEIGLVAQTPLSHQSNIGVQLFMWNWESISKECQLLADTGISWVLTSPPQEHIRGDAWWTVYQPVSYGLNSKLGTTEQFEEMVDTCNSAGVDVIADAVINHMSASSNGTGFDGTQYEKYSYPGLYQRDDFHNCQLTSNNQIQNFNDVAQVRDCELLGLSDLDQGRENVQGKITEYLQSLLDKGVAGFRIDAAKHMSEPELRQILDSLPDEVIVMHEVIPGGALQPEQYTNTGDLAWEFGYAENMNAFFDSGLISTAANASRWGEYLKSVESIGFISNHDTERNRSTLSYRQPKLFELATATMLAETYGHPMLYSSYSFDDFDFVPLGPGESVQDVVCQDGPKDSYQAGQWICQHRWTTTTNMIQFSFDLDREPMENWKRDRKIYGFSRGSEGYFLVNLRDEPYDEEIQTGLPPGVYCNYFSSELLHESTECSEQVVVESDGTITGIESLTAIAISKQRVME